MILAADIDARELENASAFPTTGTRALRPATMLNQLDRQPIALLKDFRLID